MNNKPLEIEYKFLVHMPDLKELKAQPCYKEINIRQMYLHLPEGLSGQGERCRIRKSATNKGTSCFKTYKKDVSGITRIEIEEEISEAEFNALSRYIASGTAPVEKTRHTFSFDGYTCEVDVFPFWSDKAFLEIEVESENILPPIPPFIKVIKDVSTDKAYRNSALAKRIFEGSLI